MFTRTTDLHRPRPRTRLMATKDVLALTALSALTAAIAFALNSATHERIHGDTPMPVRSQPLEWTPAPWIPAGFELLDRLLAEGHTYPSMGWL